MNKKSQYTIFISLGLIILACFFIAQQGLPSRDPSPTDRGTTMDNKEIRKVDDTAPEVRQIADFKVTGYEWVRPKEGSAIGQPEDLILVITGQGFVEADLRPIVHVGQDLEFRETYVNEGMTQLYTVIHKVAIKGLERLNFTELSVQNSGALNRDPKRWGVLKIDAATWASNIRSPGQATFRRGEYFIEMER